MFPGIVGLGKAAEICRLEMDADAARLSKLRDKLETALMANMEEVYINGSKEHRMPHVTNLSFKHVEGEGLMMTFNQEIALSSGVSMYIGEFRTFVCFDSAWFGR